MPAGGDHYEPIDWEDAFALVAERLRALPTPDAAAFYTSGRTTNEAAFLYQLFVRAFGTNNLPDCSNMCHESSGAALAHSIGIGKGTVLLEDFDAADLIIVVGQNPGTNHPRMLSALEQAKAQRRPHRHHQPARRGRAAHLPQPADPEGADQGRRTSPTTSSRCALSGDQALFAAMAKLTVRGRRGRRGVRRDVHLGVRRVPRPPRASSTGTTCSPRPG